ncbi:hypothetical protein OYT1_ch2361 [Ferriphaselus amnicola]|uniref:Uncharacterized protein n=1 Tax=Ferriphaselus amnicola TaxID=1188319 RepID=A0A2Z6GE66_9PROT|nr:hypothetical protein [Ferriphaselus amnicola]BBE51876.1 hypothetical protein OYT1_ch2361 [Ferriphaselus amnicola]
MENSHDETMAHEVSAADAEKSAARLQQLANAREALKSSGKSPNELSMASRNLVLNWIYRWGYSTATVIQQLLNRTSAGYASRLSKQGWLIATPTKSGHPKAYFTLSASGLAEAERQASELLRYPEIDPYRVNQSNIRHNLIAQVATLNAINAGLAKGYQTERMLISTDTQPLQKLPDVVLHLSSGLRLAIEVELSAKWERDLDQFVLGIIQSLKIEDGIPPAFDRFAIVSDSQAILSRYSAAMQPEATLKEWQKNSRNHWESIKSETIPDWLIRKVDFHLFSRSGDSNGSSD